MLLRVLTLVLTVIMLFIFSSKAEESKNQAQNIISIQEDLQNQLGLIYSAKKIEEANNLFKEGKLKEAESILTTTKEWLSEATKYHFDLFKIFSKESKTLKESKVEKAHALDFGNLRDQASYLLAKIYISQSKFKESVKLLIEIISSQSETELGMNAYKTLLEIKFSDKAK